MPATKTKKRPTRMLYLVVKKWREDRYYMSTISNTFTYPALFFNKRDAEKCAANPSRYPDGEQLDPCLPGLCRALGVKSRDLPRNKVLKVRLSLVK